MATKTGKYSVLLLYPDYLASDYGTETYYAFVTAESPKQAVFFARRQVFVRLPIEDRRGKKFEDFYLLNLTRGHNKALDNGMGGIE